VNVRRSGLPFVLFALLVVPSRAGAAEANEPIAADSAQGEARLDPDSVGVPGFGVVFEAGAEEQRITGRAALRYGAFALDATLSGANVDATTGRSVLFESLDSRPEGSLAAGLTWTSFSIRDFTTVLDQVETLCEEQATEQARAAEASLAEDEGYLEAKGRLDERVRAQAAATARAQELFVALSAGTAAVTDADRRELEAQTRVKATLTEVERRAAELAAAASAKDKERSKALAEAQRAVEAARAQVTLASLEATAAGERATRARVDAALAEARATEVARTLEQATAATAAAEAAVTAERRRVLDVQPSGCAASTLSPEREARVVWPFHPTYIATLRGAASSQRTEFFEPATGMRAREASHPWKMSLGVGTFLVPTMLLAASLSYGRVRVVGDASQLCEALPVERRVDAGLPYYTCGDITLGLPTWSQSTAVRVEHRQYITTGLSTNPSFTYSWSGEEKAPFAPEQGAYRLEVPVYLRASLGASDDKAVVVGAAYTHEGTWGAPQNETRDDVTLFFGGGFDLGKL
jgi:hypothetical protein